MVGRELGRRRVIVVAVALLLIFLLFFLLYKPSAVKVRGSEAALAAGAFLTQLGSGANGIGDVECVESGCKPIEKMSPHYAWRMMAFGALYRATGDRKYLEQVRREFEAYPEAIEKLQSHSTLWQLQAAYRSTGEGAILNRFLESMMFFSLVLAQSGIGESYYRSDVMTNETFARELYLAAQAFADPGTASVLDKSGLEKPLHKAITLEEWPPDFLEQARRMQEEAVPLERQGKRIVSWDPDIYEESCWVSFGDMARYLTTGDKEALERVTAFMRRMQFGKHDRRSYDLQVMQMILPCIHVLSELSAERPEFKEQFRAAVGTFLMPSFDFNGRSLCREDGSFMVLIQQEPGLQCNNVKSTADNSWVVSLLARDDSVYQLESLK